MTIVGVLLLGLWLLLIPMSVGIIPTVFMDKKWQTPEMMWISGMISLWAVFQVIGVPFILMEDASEAYFPKLVFGYGMLSVCLAVVGVVILCIAVKKKQVSGFNMQRTAYNRTEKIFWMLVLLLIGLQLVFSVTMYYADGDDAFYIAVATITESSDTMYQIMPYSVGETGLNRRYGLAPFPIWLAFLSRVSGLHTTVVAHTMVATTLIFMTYLIYYQIGKILCRGDKKKLPIFMCLTALLVMFGDYSIYTAENFMLARSRQGKAALGNIIIPMAFFLFLLMFERLKEEKKVEKVLWFLLGVTVTAACLCSTLGTFLMCMMLGVIGLCAGVVYRRWQFVVKTAACCLPALVYITLYLILG